MVKNSEDKDKTEIISELVELSAKPVITAKNYWHESIYNILRDKKEKVKGEKEYSVYLQAELIYFRNLWNKQLDIMYAWGKEEKIPEPSKINDIIAYMEQQSETIIENGKITFKDGKNLDKDDLAFIERYTSITELPERIIALEEDYLYFKIRDYITLNVYQFISHNEELSVDLLKGNTKETVQRIADLISNFADVCMYIDSNEE
ncbi:hypothetical protein [Clostridium scatologenes]|uniref:Uncharacterized protein n=1 Tax=Clostridium scatologenes TaxID=1548 RepID=A0A0E3K0T2_CLOSL|nr:hypothetical protein [Clostridium scatologenes]AKA70024.1 hypothetical protein CSCA_2899 [Clostridium scatologenes]